MAKETQKDKITRLEQELKEQRQRNEQLSQELYSLKNQSDTDFKGSTLYKQMQAEIDKYKVYESLYTYIRDKRIDEQKEYKTMYEEYQKLKADTDNLTKNNYL